MQLNSQSVAQQVGALASLPEVCIKINELIDNPNCTTTQIEQLIATDAALTARLLKVANSSLFGQSGKIENLPRAVMLLGTNALRDIAFASSSIQAFRGLSSQYVDMQTFWEHSLYTGIVARTLCTKCRFINKERMFLAGLLHDIGQLALYHCLPDEAEVIITLSQTSEKTRYAAEQQVLGFDHAELGGSLIKYWKLPISLSNAIQFHNEPWKTTDNVMEASLLHLANYIAMVAGHSGSKVSEKAIVDLKAWKTTGLTEKIIDSVIQISEDQFLEAKEIMLSGLAVAA